ncbi:MAG: hypothetical protein K2K80_04705 [Clostridia bacterium]|nr:hypothetical protein [Clostridia bacterium]
MKLKDKPRNGLHKDLKVVKTAGFKLNKKEKNTNRRAGLHDKKKNLQGEERVYRRKPLALKHVRRMRKAAVALSFIFVAAVSVFGAGMFLREDVEKITGFETVCFELPADGSSPLDHTLVENVGYLNYALKNQPYWSSEMGSTVNAMGFEQSVATYKKYYNGILISADVAQGFSSKATQFCVNEDKNVVLWRPSANKNFDGMNTEWSAGNAEGCSIEDFIKLRGFPPSEFSVYILNEKTIANAEDYSVTDNGDGTFSMTLELNVGMGNSEPERAADYYYTKQMMVTGDLSTEPSISKTSVTYVFDKNWRLASFEINDEYTAMGVVPCTSNTKVTFDYNEENAVNTFYEDYFKAQEESYAPPEIIDAAPSPTEYLGAAFGSVLSEGGIFKLDLNIDNLDLSGNVFVGLENGSLTDVRVKLGDIFVLFDKSKTLYVADGSAKYKLNLDGLIKPSESEEEGAGIDFDLISEQLMGGTFTVGENTATLESTLEIFGLKLSLKFDFVQEDKAIKLGYCSAKIPVGNKVINAGLKFGTEKDIPQIPNDLDKYTDILNEGLTVDLGLKIDGLSLDGLVHVKMNGGKFAGLLAQLGDLGVYYNGGVLYITDGAVKYKVTLPQTDGVDLSGLLNSLDTKSLLGQVIENLAAGDGVISTSAAVELLGQTVSAALGVKIVGGIEVSASAGIYGHDLSVNVGLSNRQVVLPDTAEYVDILNEGVTLTVDLAVDELKLNGKVFIGLADGKFTEVRADFGDVAVYYKENVLYITDGNVKYKVAVPASNGLSLDGFDLNAILKDVLDNLKFAEGKISTSATVSEITANVALNLIGGISADIQTEILNIPVKATVGLSPETVAEPNYDEYVDILSEGITLTVDIAVDELKLNGKVFIGLSNGKFTELRADFGEIKVYYKDNILYITDGNVKYKVALPASNGLSLDGLDLKAILKDILDNLKFADGKISTSATVSEISANLVLNLVGGISADIQTEILNIPVKATVGLTTETVAEPNYDEYVDILNEGVTLSVDLAVDELKLNGKVFIGLANGMFTEVRADFGDIAVYYKDNVLYITDGNVKYKVALPASNGISLDGLDLNAILKEVINNLKFADGKISTSATVSEITANLVLSLVGGISADIQTEISNIPVKAHVGLTTDKVAEPNYDEYVDILNEGITLEVSVAVDELKLNGKVFIGLNNGALTEVRADFGDIAVYYKDNMLYITDGNIKYKVALPASNGVSLDGLDLNAILKDVLDNLKFADGKISTGATVSEITANLVLNLVGGISADIQTEILNIPVKATVGLTTETVAEPNYGEYADILNEGVILSVDLAIDELKLNGKVYIGLNNGKFTEVRADFSEIKVYYKDNVLYITDGNVKYKVALPASNGLSLDGFDLNAILKEVINNLKFANGKISTSATVSDITANLTLNLVSGISADIQTEILNIPVKATVGLTTETVAEPNYDEYIDILNEGVTLTVDLAVDELKLNGKVYIGLKDGKFTEVRADFGEIKVYYVNNTLYVTDGNVKYKVALPASNGLSLDGLDLNAILTEVIKNLKFTDGKISTSATVSEIVANLTLNLIGGISADIQTEILNIPVKATVGLTTEKVAEPNYDEYVDILNEGVTLTVDLAVDELKLNDKVFIGLNDGKFTELRADFGDIAVYYKENVLYITDGNVKYKVALPASNGLSLDGFDLNAVLKEVISNLKFAEGKILTSATVSDITATLTLNLVGGISANIQTEILNIPVKAHVGLTTEKVAEPNYDEYVDILNEGVTLTVDLAVDELKLNGKVFIGLADGKFTELRADFGDIAVYYKENVLYITDGNVKYKVALPASNGISLDGFDLNAILKEVINNLKFADGKISTSATVNDITAYLMLNIKNGIAADIQTEILNIPIKATVGLTTDEVAEPNYDEYVDILNEGVTLTVDLAVDELKLNGKVFIGLADGKFTEVRADFGDIAVYYKDNVLYVTDGNVKYKVALPASNGLSLDGLDLNAILKDVLDNLKFAEGKISTSVTVSDIIANLTLNLVGGISADIQTEILNISVKATVGLTTEKVAEPNYDEYTDILNEGVTLSVELTLDEVTLNGTVFIGLNNGKLNALRADFGNVKVFFETDDKEIYMQVGTTKAYINFTEMPDGLVDIFKLFSNSSDGVSLDYSKLLYDLLGNLTVTMREISSGADLAVGDCIIPAHVKLILPNNGEGIKVSADTMLFGICASVKVGLPDGIIPELSDGDKESYVNAVTNIWQLADELLGNRITLSAEGTLTDAGEEYADVNNEKYVFNALVEYEKGNGIYELVIENEDGSQTVEKVNEFYLHVKVSLTARKDWDDSLELDFVLADANPIATDDNGKTLGGFYKDGKFDVYLSVSKIGEGGNPLKLYASADEILTLVTMVGAAANLDNISFKDNEYLLGAAGEIADILVGKLSSFIDETLIPKYLPHTKSQFASLGESLIPQILGTDLQGLIEKLFANSSEEKSDEGKTAIDLSAKYIESFTYVDDTLRLTLNSQRVYGAEGLDDVKAIISRDKGEDGVYKLSGIKLENIYFGADYKNGLGIDVKFSYGEIKRPDENSAFDKYLNLEGIDTFLQTAVNSATHETGDEDIPYELNHEYLLTGKINATLTSLVNIDINIHTAKIIIGDDNKVSADVHLSYPGVQELGIVAIQGACDVYLTIKNDMIYVKRVQKTYYYKGGFLNLETYEGTYETPVLETRVMPLSYFTANIMEQINFMFNFGSVVSDQLDKVDTSAESKVSFDNKDFGAILDYVLAKYKYTETDAGASWTVAISKSILTDAVGMTMSDIPVTFHAVKEDNGLFTLTGLNIEKSSLSLLGSLALEFSGNLTYCNPHEEIVKDEEGNALYSDTTCDLADGELAELGGYSWSEVLGGNTFAAISKHTNWNLLTGDTGLGYLAYGTNFKPAVGNLGFQRADDDTNSTFTAIGNEQIVLYNPETKRIYTRAQAPDITDESVMHEIEGLARVWHPEYFEYDGKLWYLAFYDTTYTVIIDSPYVVDESCEEEDGVWRKYILNAYRQVYLPKDVIIIDGGVVYGLEGYKANADNNELLDLISAVNDNGELCYVAEVAGDCKFYASWKRMHAVTFIDGENEQVVYYYDGEQLNARLPVLDNMEEDARAWLCSGNETVTEDMVVTVGYRIDIVSDKALLGDGFVVGENGEYIVSQTFAAGSTISLADFYVKNATHIVEGYYDNAEFNGEPVTEVTLDGNVVYYPKWIGKNIIVTYESDAPLTGFTSGTVATFNFDNEDELLTASGDNNIFLGWFMDLGNGAYSYADGAKGVKDYFAGLNLADEEFSITLRAACALDEITVENLKVSFSGTIKYEFVYTLHFAEGLSQSILQAAGITAEASVEYYYHGNKLVGGSASDHWGPETHGYNYDGNTKVSFSHTFGNGLNKNKKGYVTLTATFKCGDKVLGTTSEVTSNECGF